MYYFLGFLRKPFSHFLVLSPSTPSLASELERNDTAAFTFWLTFKEKHRASLSLLG